MAFRKKFTIKRETSNYFIKNAKTAYQVKSRPNNNGKKRKSFSDDIDKALHAQCMNAVDENLQDAQNFYQKALSDTISLEQSTLEILKEFSKEKNNCEILKES